MGIFSHSENEPAWYEKSKYDPLLGFKNGRKIRSTILTEEEMISCGLPARLRDYCADYAIMFKKCVKEYSFMSKRYCQEELHNLSYCRVHDLNNRIRDFERERRLMEREAKKSE